MPFYNAVREGPSVLERKMYVHDDQFNSQVFPREQEGMLALQVQQGMFRLSSMLERSLRVQDDKLNEQVLPDPSTRGMRGV